MRLAARRTGLPRTALRAPTGGRTPPRNPSSTGTTQWFGRVHRRAHQHMQYAVPGGLIAGHGPLTWARFSPHQMRSPGLCFERARCAGRLISSCSKSGHGYVQWRRDTAWGQAGIACCPTPEQLGGITRPTDREQLYTWPRLRPPARCRALDVRSRVESPRRQVVSLRIFTRARRTSALASQSSAAASADPGYEPR
jgi:hypothetical protein